MKTRKLLALIIALLLLGALFWFGYQDRKRTDVSDTDSTSQSATAEGDVQVVPNKVSTQNAGLIFSNLPLGVPAGVRSGVRMDFVDSSYGEWRTPINFYGVVVDENEKPVPGVAVDFGWTDLSPDGYSRATTTSDLSGIFALEGQNGKHLSVSVAKEGYYSSRSNLHSFFYAGENENFIPNIAAPVIFHLRKKGKGEPLIAINYPGFGRIVQLRGDGTPVEVNLISGESVSAGNGQLRLELWRSGVEKGVKRFNWSIRISVLRGGLFETKDEFAFVAPQDGYEASALIDMVADDPHWKGELQRKYFIQLPDGKYGRIELQVLPWNGVFSFKSWVNPAGSRNLETIEP